MLSGVCCSITFYCPCVITTGSTADEDDDGPRRRPVVASAARPPSSSSSSSEDETPKKSKHAPIIPDAAGSTAIFELRMGCRDGNVVLDIRQCLKCSIESVSSVNQRSFSEMI